MDLVAASPGSVAGRQARRHLRPPRRADVGGGSGAAADRGARRPAGRRAERWPSRSSAAAGPTCRSRVCKPLRRRPEPPTAVELPQRDLAFFNGLGGFSRDGREYVTILGRRPDDARAVGQRDRQPAVRHRRVRKRAAPTPGRKTATSSGSPPGTTIPVTDTSGEAIYLRDEETRALLVPLAAAGARAQRRTSPATASATASSSTPRMASPPSCASIVATDAPVKFVRAQDHQPLRPAATALGHRLLGIGPRRTAEQDR